MSSDEDVITKPQPASSLRLTKNSQKTNILRNNDMPKLSSHKSEDVNLQKKAVISEPKNIPLELEMHQIFCEQLPYLEEHKSNSLTSSKRKPIKNVASSTKKIKISSTRLIKEPIFLKYENELQENKAKNLIRSNDMPNLSTEKSKVLFLFLIFLIIYFLKKNLSLFLILIKLS